MWTWAVEDCTGKSCSAAGTNSSIASLIDSLLPVVIVASRIDSSAPDSCIGADSKDLLLSDADADERQDSNVVHVLHGIESQGGDDDAVKPFCFRLRLPRCHLQPRELVLVQGPVGSGNELSA